MRNENKIAESGADRRLGPLASLVRAAEPLEVLTAEERERIKRRLNIDLSAGHRPVSGLRLSIVVAASTLLLAGGAAVAGRFGLIRWPKASQPRIDGEQPSAPIAHQRTRGRATITGEVREGEVPSPAPTMVTGLSPSSSPAALVPTLVPSAQQPAPTSTIPSLATVVPSAHSSRTTRTIRASSTATPTALKDQPSQGGEAPGLAPPPITASPIIESPQVATSVPPPPLPNPVTPASSPSLTIVAPGRSTPAVRPATPAHGATSLAPGSTANAQDLLPQALRSLRSRHDPATALDLLAKHGTLFPNSPLASERSLLEVEALLALRRNDEALLRLDRLSLAADPRSAERHVVRGELRARAARWGEAAEDFDQALARLKKTSTWHERALWGRAMARAHAGDQTGAHADIQLYLQTYPGGRFASEAARASVAGR